MAHKAALQLALTALVALSSFSMGCEIPETSEADAFALDEVPYSTLTAGTNGSNHLSADNEQANAAMLYFTADENLATWSYPNTWTLKNTSNNNALIATSGGREVLKYAVGCALASGDQIRYTHPSTGVAVTLYGEALMTTTSGWKSAGLSLSQKQDLFACIITRMNGFGETIDFNLQGPHVTDESGFDPSNYTWNEALWAVKITPPTFGVPAFEYLAYPLDNLAACGSAGYTYGLTSRICGTTQGCGVTIVSSLNGCSEDAANPGWWSCVLPSGGSAVPMIKTRLKQVDVVDLYPRCD